MARPKDTASVPAVRGGRIVCGQQMEAAYHVPRLQPATVGPWCREAEKIAWTDAATGLACIVRREPGGHLAGYVGLDSGHPLFGFDARAIPPEAVQVHGGLSYAAQCDENGPEEVSVCHVGDRRARHADDKWWIGFRCDKLYDEIPDQPAHANEAQRLGIEQTYRDEAYLFAQCTDLAAQLQAIAAGEPAPARRSPSPPPIGLDGGAG